MPPPELGYAGRRVPVAGRERDGLGDQAAEPVEIRHAREFTAEPGGAGREKHRILEPLAEEVAGELGGH